MNHLAAFSTGQITLVSCRSSAVDVCHQKSTKEGLGGVGGTSFLFPLSCHKLNLGESLGDASRWKSYVAED